MGKRLFVGGLPMDAKDEDLKTMFAECGTVVNCTVLRSKFDPSQSRGFGFVEMETDEQAKEAVAKINGRDIRGKKIAVEEAKPMEQNNNRDRGSRPPRGGGGGRGFGGGGRDRY